jgi:hypothetical protein
MDWARPVRVHYHWSSAVRSRPGLIVPGLSWRSRGAGSGHRAGRVRGGLPGCVPGQDGDGLVEPLPLIVADKSVERGCDRGIGWVEPVRGGLAGGCGMGGSMAASRASRAGWRDWSTMVSVGPVGMDDQVVPVEAQSGADALRAVGGDVLDPFRGVPLRGVAVVALTATWHAVGGSSSRTRG